MMSNDWPDSRIFWRDKRVIVTGGSGFLGSFVVDKLRERGAAEIIVPRSQDYDLRDIQAIRRLFADVQNSAFPILHSDDGCAADARDLAVLTKECGLRTATIFAYSRHSA